MIVKFFANRGGGSPSASIDYLLGKNRDREGAAVLKGDPELSLSIAESLEFKNNYTVGCLSFEESSIDPDAKKAVMERFEKTIFAGLREDQYNIAWVEHTDKGRVELNFFIPNVELTTQKRLQPYYDKVDRPMVDCFKKVVNHEYGFTNPDLLEKKQISKINSYSPKTTKELKATVAEFVSNAVASGQITKRDQIAELLKDSGFEITRQTEKSISIKNPYNEDGKNIRFSGEIYEQEFYETIRNTRELGQSVAEARNRAEARDRQSHAESYERSKTELLRRVEYRSQEFTRSYQKKNNVERHSNSDYSSVLDRLAQHGYMVLAEQQISREKPTGTIQDSNRVSEATERNTNAEAIGIRTTSDQSVSSFDSDEMGRGWRPDNHSQHRERDADEVEAGRRISNDDNNPQNQTTVGVITFHELLNRSREYCKKLGERARNAISTIQRVDGKIRDSIKGIHDSQPSENDRHTHNGTIGKLSERNKIARSISTGAGEAIERSEQQIKRAEQGINRSFREIRATDQHLFDCIDQAERSDKQLGATVKAVDEKIAHNQEKNRGWSMSR